MEIDKQRIDNQFSVELEKKGCYEMLWNFYEDNILKKTALLQSIKHAIVSVKTARLGQSLMETVKVCSVLGITTSDRWHREFTDEKQP
ncbi:hypothetical protein AVEN_150502-1 [Araneus ventricosus]|uniref:Uncharacterized protein n=1 Tax=Araneus ventricosus TaxID=182803 RepID=A0A4Y2Q7S4_ARAVE|nr:hypothetical protein AVEN_150502-1 [Araneus ventricosus]